MQPHVSRFAPRPKPVMPLPQPLPVPQVPVGVSSARMIKALVAQAMANVTNPAQVDNLELIHACAVQIEADILRLAATAARR